MNGCDLAARFFNHTPREPETPNTVGGELQSPVHSQNNSRDETLVIQLCVYSRLPTNIT